MPSLEFKSQIDRLSDAGNDVRMKVRNGQLKMIAEVNNFTVMLISLKFHIKGDQMRLTSVVNNERHPESNTLVQAASGAVISDTYMIRQPASRNFKLNYF